MKQNDVAEMERIVRRLAALSDGLNNSNSSAEDAASRLADDAVKLVATLTGADPT